MNNQNKYNYTSLIKLLLILIIGYFAYKGIEFCRINPIDSYYFYIVYFCELSSAFLIGFILNFDHFLKNIKYKKFNFINLIVSIILLIIASIPSIPFIYDNYIIYSHILMYLDFGKLYIILAVSSGYFLSNIFNDQDK